MKKLRPLWRRQLPILAAAALFAGGNFAFFLVYRSGWQTRREALESRRDGLRQSVQSREAEAAKLATQRERLSGVSSAIEEFYDHRIGSERETLAGIVAEVHSVLKDSGITTPQISYVTSAVPKLPLTQMRISFTARSDYARLKRLIHAFENDRRWISVRSISISRDADQAGSVTVQLELATYFAPDAAPAQAGDAPKTAVAPVRKAG